MAGTCDEHGDGEVGGGASGTGMMHVQAQIVAHEFGQLRVRTMTKLDRWVLFPPSVLHLHISKYPRGAKGTSAAGDEDGAIPAQQRTDIQASLALQMWT